MILEIKCTTCGEIMGSVEKPVITEADIELYKYSVTCSNGHREEKPTEEIVS